MTIIRVTPEILAQTANRMTSVNGEIQAAIRDLSSVLNGIGGEYGGQLRNQVAPRVGQAQGAASGPTNQANALTLELNKRAQLFAAADLQSTAVAGASAQLVNRGNDTQFDVWALLAKLQLEDLLKLLAMGVLLGNPAALSALILLTSQPTTSKFLGGVFSKIPLPSWWTGRTQNPAIKGPNATTMPPSAPVVPSRPPNLNDLAKRTPGKWEQILVNGQRVKKPYYHYYYGYKGANSDCTWYVGEAIKLATGGKIDLNSTPTDKERAAMLKLNDPERKDYLLSRGKLPASLGNAYDWHTNADNYAKRFPSGPFKGVDRVPREGDIYNKDWWGKDENGNPIHLGHVAVVESATLGYDKDGNPFWRIIVSEESATGTPFVGGKLVTPDDGSGRLRWEREIILPAKSKDDLSINDDTTYFIHPNYSPTQ